MWWRIRKRFLYLFFNTVLLLILYFAINRRHSDSEAVENSATQPDLYSARLKYLQKKCAESNLNKGNLLNLPDGELRHLLIDRKHKFLYCYVPKVACTNWKKIFYILTHPYKITDLRNLHSDFVNLFRGYERFSDLKRDERKEILRTYTKFMVTRDPFERLVSAYKDKVKNYEKLPPQFQSYAKSMAEYSEILRKYVGYRKKQLPITKNGTIQVSFYQFVQYLLTPLLSQPKSLYGFNEHWKPVTDLCHPCLINYTVIAKYETISQDSNYVLDKINVHDVEFPPTKFTGTKKSMSWHFQTIPRDLLSQIYDIYKYDFSLFGYHLQDVKL